MQNPVTEPKRSQKPKRPLPQPHFPNGHSIFLTALVSISLLALATLKIRAQSADDFFHTGAQAYLTNNTTTAKEQVEKGLKLYPNDIKLKKLDDLLKQQKQQQQNQSQQNQSQSKQDQQKQQDQKKPDEQKKPDQQKQDQQNQKPEKQDDKEPPKDQPTPGEMTPDEAKKLLDSQKSDEKLLHADQNKKHDRDHPLKDW